MKPDQHLTGWEERSDAKPVSTAERINLTLMTLAAIAALMLLPALALQ